MVLTNQSQQSTLKDYVMKNVSDSIYGENTVAIYGSALLVAEDLDNDTLKITDDLFLKYLFAAVRDGKMFRPDVKSSDVAKNYCHLLLVDPMLIESVIGIRFIELFED